MNPEIWPGPSRKLTFARVQRSTPNAPPLPVGNAFRMLIAPWESAWPVPFISSPSLDNLQGRIALGGREQARWARFHRTTQPGARASLADLSCRVLQELVRWA